MQEEQLSVLVVDGSKSNRGMFVSMLAKRFRCKDIQEAGDGNEAWEICSRRSFDCIICDRDIEGVSGLEFLLKVRESPTHNKTPFLMIFSESDKESIIKAIHLGVSELLTKPYRPHELSTKLRRLLLFRERRRETRYSPEDMENEICISDGAALFSTGRIVNFSLGGVRAQLVCSPKLMVYEQMDLRMKFLFPRDENLAKTFLVQLVRIECNPNQEERRTALYSFMFMEMRPDQKRFLESVIDKIKIDMPELIR